MSCLAKPRQSLQVRRLSQDRAEEWKIQKYLAIDLYQQQKSKSIENTEDMWIFQIRFGEMQTPGRSGESANGELGVTTCDKGEEEGVRSGEGRGRE